MPTSNLGLPLITDNMTNDVPRDLNALAEAVDAKVGVAGGLATLDMGGKVVNADGSPAGGVTEAEFATHEEDEAAHGIGTETLLTTAQTLKGAINEAFTLGNSRKEELVDQLLLLDPSLPISYASTWEEILVVASGINTGKKFASGTVTTSGDNQLSFLYPGTGTVMRYFVQVVDLGFNPSTVIAIAESPFSSITILFPEAMPISTNLLGRIMTTNYVASGPTTIAVTNFRLDGVVANNIDGFTLPLSTTTPGNVKYFAFD